MTPLLIAALTLVVVATSFLSGIFGISGICNVLGAIRLARHLDLGPEDNVVTIATDGMDRYPSVLANLAKRRSLWLTCLEHGLYGCLIFTIGLGRYFYTGAAWHH